MFTRKGDLGATDTGLRERVSKSSPLIDVEGTIDELNSFIGFAKSNTQWDDIRNDLEACQRDLFLLGEHLTAHAQRRTITEDRVTWLEERTMVYKREIGPLRLFVIPGGSKESTSAHMARTVARRLERAVVEASSDIDVDKVILSYLNRISSLLFQIAIVSNKRLGISEEIWDIRRTI
ncbi:MAG: cob(I)yrinic acid a,c-diamide adenosyltransferase [Candidatus Thermoplasmatota archaeon]|jgi:ATP:cob(I)alamin adenosyltransferase|nr:cob(I)yrinic acid a,c-diamide adenosyltransferase [Candidatus Thermoplasmatota archaeon]MCL5989665.1 cob(I)yrinic acid a,c-diamide adenosyltransferase [Candidatus Thermoplasmatota archaeon]